MVEISKDLNLGEEEGRSTHGSRTRNAVPPPTLQDTFEEASGLGVLKREKPRGMESKSSAEVVLGEIHVSVRAKR
jgi:hypothetical protein